MLTVIAYLLCATLVVVSSVKASKYIDLLDKKTSLSGAFLGGVLLSAITSFPELFTSITATGIIHKPELCMGNILGSNLFNLAVLTLTGLFYIREFIKVEHSASNKKIVYGLTGIYLLLIFNHGSMLQQSILTVNLVSFLILAIYFYVVKNLSSDKEETEDDSDCDWPVGKVVLRFILASIVIILASVGMTFAADAISVEYNFSSGVVGALLLGVATSLPEVSSTIALYRLRNYNAAVGDIIGSNLFNFFVLCVVDIVSLKQAIYTYADEKVERLLIFGCIATILMAFILSRRLKSWLRIILMALVVMLYILVFTSLQYI